MIRGPFVAGGGLMKGALKMFRDIPQVNLCAKEGSKKTYPSFKHWPAIAQSWTQLAQDYKKNQFNEGFTCVQIRSEKLVLRVWLLFLFPPK